MSLTEYPNGVSSFGMPLIGITTGSVFFVCSVTGSNGNSGQNSTEPFATIDYAVGKCTADKGDIIFAMPGHAEVCIEADSINLDVAGISVIGLGNGTNRPTITYTTAAAASFGINAANITVQNIYFDATGVDAVATVIDVDAANASIVDCEFLLADTDGQAVEAIQSDVNANNMTVKNCKFLSPTAGAGAAIHIKGASSGNFIEGNIMDGDFSVAACVQTTAAILNSFFHNNRMRGDNAGEVGFDLGATTVASEGIISNNLISVADTAGWALAVGGSMHHFENYITWDGSKSGALKPAVATT